MSASPGRRRAVFWDRDGTLMHEEHYCSDPARVRAIEGLGETLQALRAAGWVNVIVTNQSGIGRGLFGEEEYRAVNAALFDQLDFEFDGVYFCPDAPDSTSGRRKPAPGMVLEAARDLGLDLPGSWFVGDRLADIACGKAAGCRTILVLTGYGEAHRSAGADRICPDARAAGLAILHDG